MHSFILCKASESTKDNAFSLLRINLADLTKAVFLCSILYTPGIFLLLIFDLAAKSTGKNIDCLQFIHVVLALPLKANNSVMVFLL